MTLVVNKRTHTPGPNDVYIGRPSKWGNPFAIGDSGMSREDVISRHANYLWRQIQSGEITLPELAALHGKTLVCWCKPASCHGDTLARAAAWAEGELAGGFDNERRDA